MKKIIHDILLSLSNTSGGYSGKKLTALAITISYCYSHRFLESEHLAAVLAVDGALIATLFGINTYSKKIGNEQRTEPEA